jgi:hypothetical protein
MSLLTSIVNTGKSTPVLIDAGVTPFIPIAVTRVHQAGQNARVSGYPRLGKRMRGPEAVGGGRHGACDQIHVLSACAVPDSGPGGSGGGRWVVVTIRATVCN